MNSQSDPVHDAIFSLLPHFGIQDAANTEDALSKLRAEIERMRTDEPERYKEVVTQALGEMRMLNEVLDKYKETIENVKSE